MRVQIDDSGKQHVFAAVEDIFGRTEIMPLADFADNPVLDMDTGRADAIRQNDSARANDTVCFSVVGVWHGRFFCLRFISDWRPSAN